MSFCKVCGCMVSADEIAITRKLINRGASEFYCVRCLAGYFEVSEAAIRERITYFKKMGCTLFAENQPQKKGESI